MHFITLKTAATYGIDAKPLARDLAWRTTRADPNIGWTVKAPLTGDARGFVAPTKETQIKPSGSGWIFDPTYGGWIFDPNRK
jgi:hypothetical protein